MMDFFKTDSVKKSLLQEAEKITEGARKLAADRGVVIRTAVADGHAGEQVVDQSENLNSDLIVVGSHGWRGVDKAIMGSTVERIIAYASRPILIAR